MVVESTPTTHGDTNGYKYDTDTDTNTNTDMGRERAQSRLPAFSMTWTQRETICDCDHL